MMDIRNDATPGEIAIYARLSKEDRDKEKKDEGTSLQSQVFRCQQWLGAQGLTKDDLAAVRLYQDDGYSGKNTERPEFQRLSRDIRKGLVKLLVFTEMSRVSRSTVDFLHMVSDWTSRSVQFVSLREKFDTTSAQGNLIITILAALNQFEREQTAIRTRANMLARAQNGLFNGGQLAIGYQPDPGRKGHLVIVEEEARLVREAFELYLDTGAPAKAATILNERGYRTPDGRPITWNVVYYMLNNPTYVGKKEVNRKNRTKTPEENAKLSDEDRYYVVDGKWPAIIDQTTWDRAQAMCDGNKKHRNAVVRPLHHDYVLSGILRCATCGQSLEGGGAKGQKYFYYRHPKGTKTPECLQGAYHAEAVEASVLARLRRYVQDDGLLDNVVARTNAELSGDIPDKEGQIEAATRKVRRLESERDNFMANLMSAPAGSVPATFWNQVKVKEEEISAAKQNVTRLEAELREMQSYRVSTEAYREALVRFNQVFEHLNPHEQRRLLKVFLDAVEVDGDQVQITLFGEEPEVQGLGENEAGCGPVHQYRTPNQWLRL